MFAYRVGKLHRGFQLAVLACALLLGPAARAALQFDVFLGYDGVLPEASWFPVVCEIKNDGPSFNAVIEINSGNYGDGQVRRLRLELPTNTRKRVVIPVFTSSRNPTWNAQLLDDRGRVQAEQLSIRARKWISSSSALIGALPGKVAGMPTLPTIKMRQSDYQPTAARFQPALFPDNPLALEGLDLIYLNSESALELKVPQFNSLLTWVQQGGHLVVGVEQITDITGNPWLRDFLPAEFLGNEIVKPGDELQKFLRAPETTTPANRASARRRADLPASPELVGDPAFEGADLPIVTLRLRDGKVIASSGGRPLIVEAGRGRGKVTVLAFSAEREPFLSWKNKPWLWSRLANVRPSLYAMENLSRYGGWSGDGIFGALIDSKQIRKLPLAWLLLLLLVYLVVIGPFDRLWLKKINRQMLTWITFPIYVVVFSALIYWIGYRLRAGEIEWNEIHIVDVMPNGPQALLRGRTYGSIYSPRNATYKISGDQLFSAFRGEFAGNMNGGQDTSKATVTQNANQFSADVFVRVWTSQMFVSDWLQPRPMPLSVSVTPKNGGWVVAAQNSLDRKLTEVHLICGGRVIDAGELAAGQRKEWVIEARGGQSLVEFVQLNGQNFFGAMQSRHQTFGNSHMNYFPNPALCTMAASFISKINVDEGRSFIVPRGLDLSNWGDKDYVVLLAWDEGHSLISPLNKFKTMRSRRDTLLRVVMPLQP